MRRDAGARVYVIVGVLLWAVVFAVVISLVLSGAKMTRSYRVYEAAGLDWLRGAPLYNPYHIEGFQYFPHSAMLMAPFAWLGQPWGGVLWRLLWWALYALGIWRLSRRLAPEKAPLAFLLASALAFYPGTGALGNGQANLAVAALMMHAAADLASQRWWRAAVVLALGVALKPLMLVPLLLAAVLYRAMAWRLAVTLTLVFIAPWLVKPHAYVMAQLHGCWAKLRAATRPAGLYEDLRGLVATLGWDLPHALYFGLRLAAALGVLALCLLARRRLREPYGSASVAALAACYLMLFNPRTQSTSYAIPAALAAVLAVTHLFEQRHRLAAALAAIIGLWMISYHQLALVQFWLKPLAAIAFAAILVRTLLAPPPAWRPAATTT